MQLPPTCWRDALNYAAGCTPIELEMRLRLDESFDANKPAHLQALNDQIVLERTVANSNYALASASYDL